MRRWSIALGAVVVFIGATPNTGRAQFSGGFEDPFFLYYGYFLPQQSFLASIPRQEDVLRSMAVQRQFSAATERATLFDPANSLMGYDPLATFGQATGSRLPRTVRSGLVTTHSNGTGPPTHYNRGHAAYFPGMATRTGRAAPRGGSGMTSPLIPQMGPQMDSLGLMRTRGRGGFGGMGGGMGGMGGLGGMGGGGFR